MLTPDGGACLVDFGIALDLERSRLTRAGTIPGTVTYMAPELLSVESRDVPPGPTDVYSMGQVLCEALTGRRCFDAPHGAPGLVKLVRQKHSSGPLDPGDGVPDEVRAVVCRLTDPDPRRRPTMAQAVRLFDKLLSPDEGELDAIDEATRVASAPEIEESSTGSWLYEDGTTEEADPDQEATLVLKVLETIEQRRARGVAEELERVSRGEDFDEVEEYSLSDPVLPDNAVEEDEEHVQAFNSADILDELRAERSRQMRARLLVGAVVTLGAALVAGLAVGLGLVLYLFR